MRDALNKLLIWLLSKLNPDGGFVMWNGSRGGEWRADVYPPDKGKIVAPEEFP